MLVCGRQAESGNDQTLTLHDRGSGLCPDSLESGRGLLAYPCGQNYSLHLVVPFVISRVLTLLRTPAALMKWQESPQALPLIFPQRVTVELAYSDNIVRNLLLSSDVMPTEIQ